MGSKYIITSSGSFVSEDELCHWGIKGMKWGVRRYQNPDGSLTSAGRKRYMNSDGTLNKKGLKKFGSKVSDGDSDDTQKTSSKGSESSRKRASDMTDAELQSVVNRLRNEDAYRDLSKKLGYDPPKTELDVQIADMEKQKKYLELQRDIKNLTPKKVSRGKKIVDGLITKVIGPAATDAGKKLLSQYLTDAGKKILTKEAKDIEDSVTKSAEKVKKKQAKKETKQSSKQAEKESGHRSNSAEGTDTSSASSSPNTVADFVSRYNDTPISSLPPPNIAGYLPAPKDDDD